VTCSDRREAYANESGSTTKADCPLQARKAAGQPAIRFAWPTLDQASGRCPPTASDMRVVFFSNTSEESTAKHAGMSRYPCFAVMSAIILGLGEVSFRVEAAQCSKPYATVDRHGRRLRARAPSSSDWNGRRPPHGCWRRLSEQSVRHLPRQWFLGRSGAAGQRAACSIAVHALHAGKSAVCDPTDRPRHCDQRCNWDFESRCSNRRPRYRVQFAHGPVPAWPPAEHFHFRLIRSSPRPIG